MTLTVVVVGGDAAGMSAASKIKRNRSDAHVIVYERGPHISYSACGMPYWLGGALESGDDLLILSPEAARAKRGIDVRLGCEVTAIDPAAKTVKVQRDGGAPFVQTYDKLIIATGARALRLPLPGVELPGVFTLRALVDAQRIHAYLEERRPQRAVVVGGGYIGLEMAEALTERGLQVHIVELLPHLLPNFDVDMVGDVTAHLVEKGVRVHTAAKVEAIVAEAQGLAVETDGAGVLLADLVILAVGVRPNSELAEAAGLRLSAAGAIWTDETMRTSDPHIYAAGDCVAHHHLALDEPAWIPLATSASKGGRIAGDNAGAAADEPVARFPGILGTAVVKVFDYTLSVTGLTEWAAQAGGKWGAAGEHVASAVITANDKAAYWPGVGKITVKLVFDRRDGRILGGQLSGKGDVNKRIDIIAAAIAARMTVRDLGMLDLSYAPPYSPVYDPVQVCANVAERQVGPVEVNPVEVDSVEMKEERQQDVS